MKNCTKKSAYCAILLQCLGNLCASFLAHTGKEKRCKIVFQTILQRFVGDLTKYPPVLFESRCSINPSFIRMAKCLPIAATLLPDISNTFTLDAWIQANNCVCSPYIVI